MLCRNKSSLRRAAKSECGRGRLPWRTWSADYSAMSKSIVPWTRAGCGKAGVRKSCAMEDTMAKMELGK